MSPGGYRARGLLAALLVLALCTGAASGQGGTATTTTAGDDDGHAPGLVVVLLAPILGIGAVFAGVVSLAMRRAPELPDE